MTAFKAETFPLIGNRLIEASAGTGKTYNIANLYLRLILGDEFERLNVEQILVVTFTRAATDELRGRIRQKIESALQAFREPSFYKESGDDAFIKSMLNKLHGEEATASRHLAATLVRMDEAAIFTIHGFSVRAIQSFLFETGALAEVELTEAENERKDKAIADMWRQLQLSRDKTLQMYFAALSIRSFSAFKNLLDGVPAQCPVIPELASDESLAVLAARHEAGLEKAIKERMKERQALAKRWDDIKKAYGKTLIDQLKPIIDIGEGRSSAGNLLKKIDEWQVAETVQLKLPSGNVRERMEYVLLSQEEGELAELARDWIEHAVNGPKPDAARKHYLLATLVQQLQRKMTDIDLASMQLDDVINLLNRKLEKHGPDADALRNMVTDQYPVCMVDEFQDTDPQQFTLFNRLYNHVGDQNTTGFFMIGDPKQSIYAFRGADIFSYLKVRKSIREAEGRNNGQHIFSLDTNFRSKAGLVAATNALFAETDAEKSPVFVYPGIEYQAVNSCEGDLFNHNKGELKAADDTITTRPLVFIGNPQADSGIIKTAKKDLLHHYAADCASRIQALLAHAVIEKDGEQRALQAADIAILVRNRIEAARMREALIRQKPSIATVFQSQRDSVFQSSAIAESLFHILRAFYEPGNRQRLKTAIVTPLYSGFAGDFSTLDALEQEGGSGDWQFESLIDEFAMYKNCWERHGILTALNLLMENRKLAQSFATQADGDRLMTDFRHLGDLLQKQYLTCGSPEQLIDWYARQLTDDSEVDEQAKRIRLESDENLVKIVTLHVSKGLQYPVVFLPFFYLPFIVDVSKRLPLVHNPDNNHDPEINFERDNNASQALMQQENMAEDMRLLYVAVTRAIYQCYIGISRATSRNKDVTQYTCWASLLSLQPEPTWSDIKEALQARLEEQSENVDYRVLYDGELKKIPVPGKKTQQRQLVLPAMPKLRHSPWLIASYSRLANAGKDVLTRGKDDEVPRSETEFYASKALERQWQDNIRFSLQGSANTGDCLHSIYEQLAREPGRYLAGTEQGQKQYSYLLEKQLAQFGLLHAETAEETASAAIAEWLGQTLDVPLTTDKQLPCLREIMQSSHVLAEMPFDFALGHKGAAHFAEHINPALQQAGVDGIHLPGREQLQGIMNGAIDLVFVHQNKVYLADYKSTTLGRVPNAYDQNGMHQCMRSGRYNLQYLIYTVAVNRYFRSRFASRYAYDEGKRLSFGGVFYLFVRGMGIPGQPQDYGIHFVRPTTEQILNLDAAFSGGKA